MPPATEVVGPDFAILLPPSRPSLLPEMSHRMKSTRFLSREFALGKVCQLYILIKKFAIDSAKIAESTETELKIVEFECFIDN